MNALIETMGAARVVQLLMDSKVLLKYKLSTVARDERVNYFTKGCIAFILPAAMQ